MKTITPMKPWASGPAEILQHAFELSQRNSDGSRRLALLTTDNAVELMIKAHLGLPSRVTGIVVPKKEYDEICDSFPRLIETLERVSRTKTEGIDLGAIEWFHRLRNELYHNGNGLTVSQDKVTAYFELARLLYEQLFEVSLAIRIEEPGLVTRFITAWVELYKTLQQMAGDQLGENFLRSTRSINDELTTHGYLDEDSARQIDRFRTIRNAVVHGDDHLLTQATVEALRSLTGRLNWQWETSKRTAVNIGADSEKWAGKTPFIPAAADNRPTKAWFYVTASNDRGYILAMVNAKGSCSMRTFDAHDGNFLGKRYEKGNYQQAFASYLENARELRVGRQPNLERECKLALPSDTLGELQQQIHAASENPGESSTA